MIIFDIFEALDIIKNELPNDTRITCYNNINGGINFRISTMIYNSSGSHEILNIEYCLSYDEINNSDIQQIRFKMAIEELKNEINR